MDVQLESLSTEAGPPPHLVDVSLHVRYGELFTVLGPPHSGKTAILRAIAGFLPLSRGRVLIDSADVGGLAPRARGIGYVFHQGALWPHLTVRQHVAFGLEQLGMPPDEIERRVEIVTHRLGLAAQRDRLPHALTLDGQRRLALARALAVEPRVLLLDEPLAHLDPLTRKTLRLELARLHGDLAVTTICATRDAADAMALSDRIAIVAGGRIAQVGDPESLYRRPVSRDVAEALGPANFLSVRVVEVRELGVVVETRRGDQVPVPGIGAFHQGSRGRLVLRPETLSITEAAMARGPGIPGQVSLRVFEGARYLYEIDVGAGDSIRVELPAGETSVFRLGDRVRIEISSDSAVLLPDDVASSVETAE